CCCRCSSGHRVTAAAPRLPSSDRGPSGFVSTGLCPPRRACHDASLTGANDWSILALDMLKARLTTARIAWGTLGDEAVSYPQFRDATIKSGGNRREGAGPCKRPRQCPSQHADGKSSRVRAIPGIPRRTLAGCQPPSAAHLSIWLHPHQVVPAGGARVGIPG